MAAGRHSFSPIPVEEQEELKSTCTEIMPLSWQDNFTSTFHTSWSPHLPCKDDFKLGKLKECWIKDQLTQKQSYTKVPWDGHPAWAQPLQKCNSNHFHNNWREQSSEGAEICRAFLVRFYNDSLVEFHVHYRYRNTAPQIIMLSFANKLHFP